MHAAVFRRLVAHAFAAAALLLPAARADAQALRYRCAMPDGAVAVLAQDLSSAFGAVRHCEPLQVGAAPASVPEPSIEMLMLEGPRRPAGLEPARGRDAGSGGQAAPPAAGLSALVMSASRRYRLDYQLLTALIYVESRFQPQARSPKGALGLMQIMPATGARYGVDAPQQLLIPEVNIDVGARYLRDLQQRFEGQVELMLAAYNAGEAAVERYGNRIPPYPETQDYVRRILALQRGE
jgi:soluble lytic murein transglycosylase-like protein